MPTVVIASPKGGAGKSTAAILLGTELAHAGASVVMLDCDPNHSLTLWADRAPYLLELMYFRAPPSPT